MNIRYANIIPLIGGMTIANINATGNYPVAIFSYAPFNNNEKHIRKYFEDRNINVPYIVLDDNPIFNVDDYKNLDFVSSVCPCAGMSLLNTNNKQRGSNAPQNDWLIKSSEFVLGQLKPKVYWGENAPGLYSELNIDIANRLKEIGKKYGYTFSIYKTDTKFHGIPQGRARTFFFFWKLNNQVPVLGYYERETPLYVDWMTPDKNEGPYKNIFIKYKFPDDESKEYVYIKSKYHNNDYKDLYNFCNKHNIRTTSAYLQNYVTGLDAVNAYKEYLKWLENNDGDKKVSLSGAGFHTFKSKAEFYITKFIQGKGVFDISPIFAFDNCPAIIPKNVHRQLHPTEERFISVQESMKLMGLPEDFELASDPLKCWEHICQNVPVCTAEDMTKEVIDFIYNYQHYYINTDFLKQNNLTHNIDYVEKNAKPLF